jgi:hypothetical protein
MCETTCRSTRSVKKPTRFEPVLKGQGGEMTPTKESSVSPIVQKVRTDRKVIEQEGTKE